MDDMAIIWTCIYLLVGLAVFQVWWDLTTKSLEKKGPAVVARFSSKKEKYRMAVVLVWPITLVMGIILALVGVAMGIRQVMNRR